MSSEKIQFRCTDCNKLLAVDSAHAGKSIACPACQTKMRVPVGPSAPASLPPKVAQFTSTKSPFPESKPFPTVPKANAAVTHPSNSVSPLTAPTQSRPSRQPTEPTTNSSLGRSIGGLVTAGIVAGVCSIVWVIVVAITSRELGILAWGIGGAVGLVAGVIARNPSPIFCSLTAGVAVMSVLFAKCIMAATLMVAGMGANFMKTMMQFDPEQQKLSHALVDQMLVDSQLVGQEKEYAESYNARFFSGGEDEESLVEQQEEEQADEMLELGGKLEEKWNKDIESKSPEQRETLLVAMRTRHPEWIEDNNHYLAMVDKLVAEPGRLSDELAAQAKSELALLTGNWDSDYHGSVAPNEIRDRRVALKKLVVEALTPLDALQRDQAVRDTLQRNLNWMPYNDAYVAMLDKMNTDGKFNAPIADFAKASAEMRLAPDELSTMFESTQADDFQAKTKELQVLVNQALVPLDASQRTQLVSEAQTRHPDWIQQDNPQARVEKLDEAFEELGGENQTFLGSLRSVMSFFDVLWIVFGATTAYGTAKRQAIPIVA